MMTLRLDNYFYQLSWTNLREVMEQNETYTSQLLADQGNVKDLRRELAVERSDLVAHLDAIANDWMGIRWRLASIVLQERVSNLDAFCKTAHDAMQRDSKAVAQLVNLLTGVDEEERAYWEERIKTNDDPSAADNRMTTSSKGVQESTISEAEIAICLHKRQDNNDDQLMDEIVFGETVSFTAREYCLSIVTEMNKEDTVLRIIHDMTIEAKQAWVKSIINSNSMNMWLKVKLIAQLTWLFVICAFNFEEVFKVIGQAYKFAYRLILQSSPVNDCSWLIFSANGIYYQRETKDFEFVRWGKIEKLEVDDEKCKLSINGNTVFLTISNYHFVILVRTIKTLADRCCVGGVQLVVSRQSS